MRTLGLYLNFRTVFSEGRKKQSVQGCLFSSNSLLPFKSPWPHIYESLNVFFLVSVGFLWAIPYRQSSNISVVKNNLEDCLETDRSLVCAAHELADHPQYHPSTVLMIFTMHTLARRVVLIFYVDPKGPFFFWDGMAIFVHWTWGKQVQLFLFFRKSGSRFFLKKLEGWSVTNRFWGASSSEYSSAYYLFERSSQGI